MNDLATGADRLDLLRTFLRIVDAGSLSAAAVQLGTTQPTVSRRLQALERQLGLRLLQRSTHGLQLTEDGLRCQRHAQRVVDEWESLQAELQGEPETLRGRLRVMVPHAFGQAQLLPTMLAFLAQHPQLSLEWILEDRRPDFVAEGIDCAVRVGPVDEPRMVALPLAEVPRIVVAAPSLVQATVVHTPEQAQSLPWISLVTYYRERLLLHDAQGRAHMLSISPRLLTDNLFVVQQAARAGLGAAVVSAWLVAEDLAQGRLVQLLPDWQAPALPVHVVFPAARQQPPRLRAFIDAMKAALPQLHGMRPAPR
ncbi:LysR family transcriptional regulator [Mesorhizobium sp. M00.F.Ca.ET.151.01.1.1]|nr:LysR family transcriptional regulator [bacterium M00.F.Ca.ET.199.01.1.1]TGT09330.1 LysR family transcriptional regulator [bacterium M00.F.Ca.ET.177.01.1.1]TGT67266.1 LysR family transcriptional regulator [Mesorhizobium sp. M00.F.Ca.ET.170.01.1.1]TGU16175.1 LysR family transcriptional regulator [bacterium M00.F.Ca.ET.163.01.1.1]TGU98905.1 LysR family transcriptional regulator [Mesorhizobium sp. M00.F.Ca.ET.151.01.1.1]TGV60569.1 LysR family transcriptional regulator [bacterium M00.F.Ca.ET.141